MGLFDCIFGKKKKKKSYDNYYNNVSIKPSIENNYLFSKNELQNIISILINLSRMFRNSISLNQVGGNRNIKMMNIMNSYIGMFCFLYESYKYGKANNLLEKDMIDRYAITVLIMSDHTNKKNCISQLSDNWADVLKTIMIIKLSELSDADLFLKQENNIEYVTKAIEKWSGKVCSRPKI